LTEGAGAISAFVMRALKESRLVIVHDLLSKSAFMVKKREIYAVDCFTNIEQWQAQ
jgi:hypothetical protein